MSDRVPELRYLKDTPARLQEFIDADEVVAYDRTGWEEAVYTAPLPSLKPDGSYEKRPSQRMRVPIDRSIGELALLLKDCLTFKGPYN
jgi:hypothetical protein